MAVTFKSRQEINPDSWSIYHFMQTPTVQMENIDEELKINICKILPSISEETVDGIIHALKYAGLEMMSDLKFVQEEDLILVLKPIQRRKLVNAWRELNTSNSQIYEINKKVDQYVSSNLKNEEWSRQSVSTTPSETENASNSQTDEINKKGDKHVPSNGEWSTQSISTTPSETESFPPVILSNLPPKNDTSSVNASSSLSEQNCDWDTRRTIKLLQLYAKYKTEFSHPDIEEQMVWKKIADEFRSCDELQCRDKILELSWEYERIKNENVTSRKTAIFLDEAKKAFETTKTTGQTNPLFFLDLKKSNKDFLSKLLQVYAKYKTELACPNKEEQNVWEKIAKEMKDKFSYACGETLCRFELLNLKCQYESLKRDGVKNKNMVYLYQDVIEAFESSENLDTSNSQIDEINKNVEKYLPPHLKNGESMWSVSTISSETENTSNSQIDEINKKVDKYVPPHLKNGESVWSVSTISSETESIPPVTPSNLPSGKCTWNRNKCLVLLQVYPKYKTELSRSSIEEKREVWRKIAEEVRQRCSLKCNELQCMDKIKKLKSQYYIIKYQNKNELSQSMTVFFNELKNAFDNSKKAVISPVGASGSLSVNWIKDMKRDIRLLRRYAKYKPELSHPDVEKQTVWKKIAGNYEESSCYNKIDELRHEYERIRNENVTNRETAMFLDEAKRAFETTETTTGKFSISFKKSNKDFLRKLLQVYTKCKTEFAFPDPEEQNVWEKIAREVTETSRYFCGARLCCFELVQLKSQYENFKRTGVKNGDMAHFLDEAREAFEDSEKLGRTFTIKVRNLSENVEKPDLQDLFGHFGKIAHISDIKSSPGKSKRYFAYIKFQKEEDATRAIQVVNGYEYDKLILKVDWAETSQTNEVLE